MRILLRKLATVVVVSLAPGCSDSPRVPAMATAPTLVVPPSVRDRIDLQVTRGSASRSLGSPSLDYSYCRQMTNVGPGEGSYSMEMTVFGPAGEVLVKGDPDPFGVGFRSIRVGSIQVGCGRGLSDHDTRHPIGVRYRLRISFTFPDGLSGDVEGEASIDNPGVTWP